MLWVDRLSFFLYNLVLPIAEVSVVPSADFPPVFEVWESDLLVSDYESSWFDKSSASLSDVKSLSFISSYNNSWPLTYRDLLKETDIPSKNKLPKSAFVWYERMIKDDIL